MRKCLIIIFIISIGFNYPCLGSPKIKLGTSTVGANYYKLGQSIKSLLQQSKLNIQLEVVDTQGSIDNIVRLSNGELDLAIVQNDIAFLAENGLYPFEYKITGLRGMITFYFEPIYVITNIPNIRHLYQLSDHKVNMGPEGGGLFADAKIILNSLNLYQSVVKTNYNPSQVLNLLNSNEIQASFVNNISEELFTAINGNTIFIVPLNNQLIQSLTKTYPYFNEFRSTIYNETITTIAVKSILICRVDFNEHIAYQLTNILYNNFDNLTIPSIDVRPTKNEISLQMPLEKWHEGSKKYLNEIGIMKSQTIIKYLWLLLFIPMIFLLIVLFLNFLFFSVYKKIPFIFAVNSISLKFIKSVNIFFIKYKYLMIVLLMLTMFLTDIIIVQKVEHNWAIRNNVISNFDNNPFFRNLLWLFVFGGSGYYDNLFPQSSLGKFLVTLIPLIGIGGIITIIGLITSDHIKKKILEAKGEKIKMIKNHIILCGWNENVPFLVKNMLHENIIHKKPIVILADIEDEMPLEKFGLKDKLVSYIKGDATNKADLSRANLRDADIAIIVTDSDSSDPDAKNILKILTIEKYCRELEEKGIRKNRDNIYTIAEIQDANKFELAYDAYVDEIVLLGHIKSKILVQSVLNPGVSKFINEILTYNDFNDIYSIQINRGSKLVGSTFDELLVMLRKYKILLLSISLENRNAKDTIVSIKERHNLERCVITNPINETEINYRTTEGDVLIVLAQYEKIVENAINLINQ